MYLYALVSQCPGERIGRGLAGEPLKLMRCGRIVAVVGEMDEAPVLSAAVLKAQDAIVRRLFKKVDSLLPARFGRCFDSATELTAAIDRSRGQLADRLRLVTGAVQMTVRAYNANRRTRPAADPSVSLGRGSGAGARYLSRRSRMAGLPELARLEEVVGPMVRVRRQVRHGTPPLTATIYDLIPKKDAARYLKAVRLAGRRTAGVRFVASGPHPPYAFAAGEDE
jgi:hypothetical protein